MSKDLFHNIYPKQIISFMYAIGLTLLVNCKLPVFQALYSHYLSASNGVIP